MNVMEAIKIKKEGGRIERKLSNGLTEVKWFWDNGQISSHFFLNENGAFCGELKWWWENGTLGERINYKNGKLHGELKWWFSNGTIWKYKLFENDEEIVVYVDN